MVSKLLNATSEFQDSRGQWFPAHDPRITLPGAVGTNKVCFVTVPFAHHLLRAVTSSADRDRTGNHVVSLYEADDGDAKAGTFIAAAGTLVGGFLLAVDSGGTAVVNEFVLTNAHKLATAGARTYWLDIGGTDANDLNHRPQLALLVEPVIRSVL